MAFSTAAKNSMLDALTVDLLSLHSGDPGASGTSNEISGGGYARAAATFAAASGGERALSTAVDFTGTAAQSVTYVGFWKNDTEDVFHGSKALTGDSAFNSAGEFRITTATKLSITDPA